MPPAGAALQKKNVKDGRPMRGMVLSDEKRALILRIMLENGELAPHVPIGVPEGVGEEAKPSTALVEAPGS